MVAMAPSSNIVATMLELSIAGLENSGRWSFTSNIRTLMTVWLLRRGLPRSLAVTRSCGIKVMLNDDI